MEIDPRTFLLIQDGMVVNAIVCDNDFAELIRSSYDYVIDQTGLEAGMNWLYDGVNWSPPLPSQPAFLEDPDAGPLP